MIYGVFGGCYSDWYIVGYFNNRTDADKYCCVSGNGDYYVRELKDLSDEKDLSKVSLKYKHEIVFDFKDNMGTWVMRNEQNRYECYVSENFQPNSIKYMGYSWVGFFVNIAEDNRKLAEKIAEDYLYQLLLYGDSRKIYQENIDVMNNKFLEPYKIQQELKEKEELRKKGINRITKIERKVRMNVCFHFRM